MLVIVCLFVVVVYYCIADYFNIQILLLLFIYRDCCLSRSCCGCCYCCHH